MYGMMEGLTAGVGLGRQARQDALAMEEAAANRRMREEQLAMQKTQHDLNMRLLTGQVNDAEQVRGLRKEFVDGMAAPINNARTFAAQDQDFETAFRLSGEGKDIAPADPKLWGPGAIRGLPTERQQNDLLGRIAVLEGKYGDALALRAANQKLDINDAIKADLQRAKDDPSFRESFMGYVNHRVPTLAIQGPQYDKNNNLITPTRVSVVQPDGKLKDFNLSDADLQQLIVGSVYMRHNMVEQGLGIIKGVNKDIGDAISRANEQLVKAADSNIRGENVQSDAMYRRAGLVNDTARTKAQIAHWEAIEKNNSLANKNPLTPEEQTKLIDLQRKFEAAVAANDPKTARALQSEHNMIISAAAIRAGKPSQLQLGREAKPIDPKELRETIEWLASRPENKSLNTAALEGKARAMLTGVPYESALDRAIAADKGDKPGGLPQPNTPAAPVDPITTLPDNMLRRIAAIQGHAKQAAAVEELARRAAAQPDIDITGFGYR